MSTMINGFWDRLSFGGKFVFSVFDPVQRTLETSSGLDPVCLCFVTGIWEEPPNTDDDVREEDIWHEHENEPNDHKNIHNHGDGIGI